MRKLESYGALKVTAEEISLCWCRIVIFGEINLSANGFPEFNRFLDESKILLLQFLNSVRNLESYGPLEETEEIISLNGFRIVIFNKNSSNVNGFPKLYRFPDDSRSFLLHFPSSVRNLEYSGTLEVTAEEFSLNGFCIMIFNQINLSVNGFSKIHKFPDESERMLLPIPNSVRKVKSSCPLKETAEKISLNRRQIVNIR